MDIIPVEQAKKWGWKVTGCSEGGRAWGVLLTIRGRLQVPHALQRV